MTSMDDVRFAHFVIVGLILVIFVTTPAYQGYEEQGFFSRAWYHFTMIPIWILGFSFMYDYMKYFLIWYSQWSYPDIYTKMQGYSQLLRHAYSRLTATPGRILSICLEIDFKSGLRSWYHKWCPDFYSKVQLSARLLRHAYSRLTATPGRILSICLEIDFKSGLRSWYHKWCPDFYSKVQLLARFLRHAYSRNLSIPVCILRNRFTVDFKECFSRWYHKCGERNDMARHEHEAADSHSADSQMAPEIIEVAMTTEKSDSSENLRTGENSINLKTTRKKVEDCLTNKKPRKEKKKNLDSRVLAKKNKKKREMLIHEDMTLNLLSLLYTAAVTKVKFVVLVDVRLPLWSDDVPFCWTDFLSFCITTNMADSLQVFARHSLCFGHWPAQAIGPIGKHPALHEVEAVDEGNRKIIQYEETENEEAPTVGGQRVMVSKYALNAVGCGADAVGHVVVFKFLSERNDVAHNEREAADSHSADSQMAPEIKEVAMTTEKSDSSENLRTGENSINLKATRKKVEDCLTNKKPRKEKKKNLDSRVLAKKNKKKREMLIHEDMTLNLLSLLYTAAVTKVKFVVLVDLRLPLWSDDVPFCWTDFLSSCITTNMADFLHVFVRHSLRFSHWPAQAIGPVGKHPALHEVEALDEGNRKRMQSEETENKEAPTGGGQRIPMSKYALSALGAVAVGLFAVFKFLRH